MRQLLPKRTIYWNESASGWYDEETDVCVENLPPPEALSQSNHHPFDKSFTVTYEQVQKMIADAFEQRTVDVSRLHYFAPDDDKLITYVFHRTLMQTIQVLGARLNRIEQPWWKRWWSR